MDTAREAAGIAGRGTARPPQNGPTSGPRRTTWRASADVGQPGGTRATGLQVRGYSSSHFSRCTLAESTFFTRPTTLICRPFLIIVSRSAHFISKYM